jgi:tetratricopeptide (TPR) repeat protein
VILPLFVPAALLYVAPAASGAETLFREARNLRMEGRYFEAADRYRKLLKEFPSDGRVPEARYWLAATLEQDQRWDEAAAAYTDFLNQHPDQRLLGRQARLNRIQCWGLRQGQNPEATPGLLSALREEAQDVRIAAALQLAKRGERRAEAALQSGLSNPKQAPACLAALESMGIKPQAPKAAESRFLVVRIREKGKADETTVRIAAGFARLVSGYLDDEQLAQAKRKGIDLEDLMDQIQQAPKGSVLFSVESKESRITVTVE